MNVHRFFGITLATVGILVALVTGGCALVFGFMEVTGQSALGQILPLIFGLGVLPCIVGVGIAWFGIRLTRSAGVQTGSIQEWGIDQGDANHERQGNPDDAP